MRKGRESEQKSGSQVSAKLCKATRGWSKMIILYSIYLKMIASTLKSMDWLEGWFLQETMVVTVFNPKTMRFLQIFPEDQFKR